MESPDISSILDGWPHEGGRINVRFVAGTDGRRLLQIRLDLGLLQLETSGRPDGRRPHGCESLLHHHQERLRRWIAAHGGDRGFALTPEECAALRDEAVQFYHRYVGLLVLEDYEGVVRDTTRNLEVFDLCHRHAAEEADRAVLEQFRAYVIMMRARAEAAGAVNGGRPKEALAALDRGLAEIRSALEEAGGADGIEESNEVQLLRGMREMLVPRLPASQRSELQERLRSAIAAENYELAAILRDELRLLEE